MGKLINRIPGLRLLISSLPGSALRMQVESLGKPGKLDIKIPSPSILYLLVFSCILYLLVLVLYSMLVFSSYLHSANISKFSLFSSACSSNFYLSSLLLSLSFCPRCQCYIFKDPMYALFISIVHKTDDGVT